MSKVCLNCQEEDTNKLVGDLCKACKSNGVVVKGTSIIIDGKVINGPKVSKKIDKKRPKKK